MSVSVCIGQWSDWDDWSACSAACQLGSQSPTRYRNRTCEGPTFNATCPPLMLNGISYYGSQTENCNSEKPCNGMCCFVKLNLMKVSKQSANESELETSQAA